MRHFYCAGVPARMRAEPTNLTVSTLSRPCANFGAYPLGMRAKRMRDAG
jgi:hypothetical protein